MNLATIRANVRRDLRDEDAANYRWSNDEIDRHITRAVKLFSQYVPRERKSTLTTTAGSRELSLASLSDLLWVEAVEYPAGQFPPQYVRFSAWTGTLTMLIDGAPAGAENVNIYWNSLHTLDGTSSTIPAEHEELVALGAAAYAALAWSEYAVNVVNVGGAGVTRSYGEWGRLRLEEFYRELRRASVQGRLRARQLYRPFEPARSQSRDWGP